MQTMVVNLVDVFGVDKPVIGMVHLTPLPGSSKSVSVEDVFENALMDAEALKSGGVDGVQVENFGDAPFMKPGKVDSAVVSLVACVANEVKKATGLPTGIFVLANAVVESLFAAKASGASWVRANMYNLAYIADEGYIEASAPKAERKRTFLGPDVKIFADVLVKHGSHVIVSDIPLSYHVTRVEELGADAVILSGTRTSAETPYQRVVEAKQLAKKPVLVGSGVNLENVHRLLKVADGAIVGTYFKRVGELFNPVDLERVRRLMSVVRALRV